MKTRDDVLATIEHLLRDLQANPDACWDNPTLGRYLEAIGAWLKATNKIGKPPPSWELIIEMLETAKIYE
jgi:hypothetical protein